MTQIYFRLLSTPAILMDGRPVMLPLKKAEGLLYYLALKKTVTREQAAELLWDDAATAKKNLRHTLYAIKKAFGMDVVVSPKKHLLALAPGIDYDTDYDRFMESGNLFLCEGELLPGFGLKNAEGFESWLEMERLELRTHYLQLIYTRMTESDDLDEVEALFARYLKKDALDERVYQLMMACYQREGLYYKGIKVYQNVRRLLNAELRIAPCAELTELHRQMLRDWTEATAEEEEAENAPTGQIIGRADAMGKLMKAYRDFLMGSPTALLLLGDNGVGKTYLVSHFLDSIGEESCIILRAICFQEERDFVLQPWDTIMLQLARQLRERGIEVPQSYLNHINTLFPMFSERSPGSPTPEDAAYTYSYRTARNSMMQLLSLVGEETPIILFFDNIHYMDPLSLELLSMIIRDRSPNIFCLLSCLDVQPPPLQKQINALTREKFLNHLLIEPFTRQDVADIIEARLGPDALSEQVIDHIYRDSEGNGFFLDMLLGYLGSAEKAALGQVPLNPQDMLMARLEPLSTEERQLLDILSVCPESMPLDIVEDILSRETIEIIELIGALKEHGLIRERVERGEIRFQFRHAKMQDFVHSQLSPSKRRLLHARVAAYYEQTPGLLHTGSWYQRIIYHYAQAGSEAKVLQYKILSLADYSRYNYELYPVFQPKKDPDLEAPQQLTKYFDELIAELTRLSIHQPGALDYAELENRLFYIIGKHDISQGRYKSGLAALRRSLRQVEYLEEHPTDHINCLRQLTFYGIQVWDTNLMQQNITRNIALARTHRLGVDYAVECRLMGLYLMMSGRYEESKEQLMQAIELFEATPLDGKNYNLNLAACYNYLGELSRRQMRFAEALEDYDRALALCHGSEHMSNPTFCTNKALALLALGQIEEADALLHSAQRLYDASHILVGRATTQSYRALLAAMAGDHDTARRIIPQADRHATALGSPMEQGIVARNKALLRTHFPEHYADLIPEPTESYLAEARRHLAHLPGAYELKMPLELPA
jgi:DNA-binding SARP family transcriptional activator/predicted ATPase